MKKLFLLLITFLAVTFGFAQNTLVATLSHGSDITMYYGAYALRDAHNAAVSGDIINLSGGAFQAVKITKAVTLRGTGIDHVNPTYLIKDFDINIPATDAGRFSMEGIRCTGTLSLKGPLSNAFFLKSQFYWVHTNGNSSSTPVKNALFANCKITYKLDLSSNSIVQCINSYIEDFTNYTSTTSSASFANCVIKISGNWGSSQFTNCIFYLPSSTSYTLPSSSIANNCIIINNKNFLVSSPASSGCKESTFEETFADFTGTYTDSQTFELTEEAKTSFLGTDGTQVGMYGGIMPYTSTPSYPQITKMNVANKTTADGKLSVEIEVNAAQ